MEPGGLQCSVAQLFKTILVAFVLLTAADWVGIGHHSTGAVTAPVTSLDRSPHWSGRGGANQWHPRYAATCARCGIAP